MVGSAPEVGAVLAAGEAAVGLVVDGEGEAAVTASATGTSRVSAAGPRPARPAAGGDMEEARVSCGREVPRSATDAWSGKRPGEKLCGIKPGWMARARSFNRQQLVKRVGSSC